MTVQTFEKRLQHPTAPAHGRLTRWLYLHAPPRAIHDRKTLRAYLEIVDALMEAREMGEVAPEDKRGVREYLEVLLPLIQSYESTAFPRRAPTPEGMLEFLMDQHKLSQYDLAAELGGQPVVSAILNGKRKLNRRQIERLAKRFHITPGAFYPHAA
jgi:HTH-type transcriptional regulator/antitoxin HigA